MSLPTPYYDRDGITIYCADCREVLPHLEPGSIDLVLTDPPYGIGLNNDWQDKVHASRSKASNRAKGGMKNDEGEIDASLLSAFPRRIVFGFPYLLDEEANGWLVWDKEPGFAGRSLTSPVEMAYSTTWAGFRAIRLLWSGYMRAPGSESKVGHPTQKPESLMRRILEWHTEDAVVLDPFMGSGTTLRAAKDLGRKAIGIEIEEKYAEIAVKRLQQSVLPGMEAA